MEFLLALALTTVGCYVFRKPLKRYPLVFYGLAILLVAAHLSGTTFLNNPWWRSYLLVMQRCLIAMSLFTIVMFIGVFPKQSKASLCFRPIRAELSIIAWILCMGHACAFLPAYLTRLGAGNLSINAVASIVVALVLFALLLVLGVTSFQFVKRRMSSAGWRKLQRLAYVFFGLVYVHIAFILAPSALLSASQARTSIVVYSVVMALYAIARIGRAVQERREASRDAAGKTQARLSGKLSPSDDAWIETDSEALGRM